MQPYLSLYLKSLESKESRNAAFKNLRAAYLRLSGAAAHMGTVEQVFSYSWHTITLERYSDFRNSLMDEGLSTAYINTILSFLRKTLYWAYVNEDMPELTSEQCRVVLTGVKSNVKKAKPIDDGDVDLDWLLGEISGSDEFDISKAKGLSSDIVHHLIKSIGHVVKKDYRDKAMFMLMSHAGLRREEVVDLSIRDLSFKKGAESITVVGKGAKRRVVPISEDLLSVIRAWVEVLFAGGGLKKSDPLFCKINSVGRPTLKRLTKMGLYYVLRRIGENEGVEGLHPHALRHYFATQLLAKGVDVFQVADLLGHSSINTTRVYDARGFEQLQTAVNA